MSVSTSSSVALSFASEEAIPRLPSTRQATMYLTGKLLLILLVLFIWMSFCNWLLQCLFLAVFFETKSWLWCFFVFWTILPVAAITTGFLKCLCSTSSSYSTMRWHRRGVAAPWLRWCCSLPLLYRQIITGIAEDGDDDLTQQRTLLVSSFIQEHWEERSCKQVLNSTCRLLLALMVWAVSMCGFFAVFVALTHQNDYCNDRWAELQRRFASSIISLFILGGSIVFFKGLTVIVARGGTERESFFIFGDDSFVEEEDEDDSGPLLSEEDRTIDL